ncbi:MAG: response regulator [Candidatus Omnitrophota bacterium]|jgi:two-component system response regulator VicR
MPHKLLLVDDDKEIIETLKPRLQREGYDVIEAFDGEEGLRMVKDCNPDIILLDLIMPKLNGFDVLKEIRTNINDRWRPVIIISTNAELDSIRKGYDMEADHYLAKPCTIDAVLHGIKTMVSLLPARIK